MRTGRRIERGRHLRTMTARTSGSSLPKLFTQTPRPVLVELGGRANRRPMERPGRIQLAEDNFLFEGNVVVFITGNLAAGYGHFGNVLNHEANGV